MTPESVAMIERHFSSRFSPSEAMTMGVFLVKQVRERFSNGGSMAVRWPAKRFNDDRAILTGMSAGRTGGLLGSFKAGIMDEGKGAFVGSTVPYARVHQLGAGPKKGGQLPAIVPKTAKALFIPLTDRARTSSPMSTPAGTKVRVATTGPSKTKIVGGQKVRVRNPLIQGRISKSGDLEALDQKTGKWGPGKPDFLFLRKVEIPPRPMLPDSMEERREQENMVNDILKARIKGK